MFSLTIPKRSRWLESPGVPNNQLSLVVYPTIYTVLAPSKRCLALGFQPSNNGRFRRRPRVPERPMDASAPLGRSRGVEERAVPERVPEHRVPERRREARRGDEETIGWWWVSEWKRDPLKKGVGWLSDLQRLGMKRSRRLESPGLCLFFGELCRH